MFGKSLIIIGAVLVNSLNIYAGPQKIKAHYTFDNDPKGQIEDSSGQFEPSAIPESAKYIKGVKGKALSFDGKTVIDISNNKLTIQPGNALSFWICVDEEPGNEKHSYSPGIFCWKKNGCYDGFLTLNKPRYPKDSSGIAIEDAKGKPVTCTTSKINPGKWYHIAVNVDDKGTVTFYLDGKASKNNVSKSGLDFVLPLYYIGIGYAGSLEAGKLKGALDEIIIFNQQLTAEDVAKLAKK